MACSIIRPTKPRIESKAGWILAAIYLAVSLVSLYLALHCRDGFFCGIRAIPMLIPAGVAYLLLLANHLDSPAILQWRLIVPTVITNVAFYYLLGCCIGRIVGKR